MTWRGTSVTSGQLSYDVDGVFVVKNPTRFFVANDDFRGHFNGTNTATATNCFDPAFNGSGTETVNIDIAQSGSAMTQIWTLQPSVTCSHNGTYSQAGRMGTLSSTWSCSNGGSGTMTMFQMTNKPLMFMTRYVVVNNENGCNIDGKFAGVIPR